MGGKKKKSVKMILISVLLILVGILLFIIAMEKTKTGWYEANIIRHSRREALDYCLAVCLFLLGCFNLFRGLKGKAFETDIGNILSSHEDGSPYACPHCGAKLEQGQFSCRICGTRIL